MAFVHQRFSIDYSKQMIENKRNFSLHTEGLVKKCHLYSADHTHTRWGVGRRQPSSFGKIFKNQPYSGNLPSVGQKRLQIMDFVLGSLSILLVLYDYVADWSQTGKFVLGGQYLARKYAVFNMSSAN